jgi:hypothetical protein
MLYNAIGGAGSTLSGHLRETESRRLQVEAELRAQAERDALLERTNRELADFDKKYSETNSKAQELGMQLPAPGSIDDQIFRSTGEFGFTPNPRMAFGQTTSLTQRGGTQIPVSTPRTEWAPSQAESAVSADAIRATKELLSGKSVIDTDRFFKRLELIQGAQRDASRRPSTSGMATTLGDQAKGLSDFMTREGVIANDGRQLQSGIAGKFMDNRALSARDRQGTEYKERQANARNNADNATSERINKANNAEKQKDRIRMEDRELRLLAKDLETSGKNEDARKVRMIADLQKVYTGDMDQKVFKTAYPDAKIDDPIIGSMNISNLPVAQQDSIINARRRITDQMRAELANRVGDKSPVPGNPAVTIPGIGSPVNLNSAGYKL